MIKKISLDNPSISEKIAKSFVGDDRERVPFPYRSGPKLISFFNLYGFHDKYGSGFPTRWVYAEERIKTLIQKGREKEFFRDAVSIEELMRFEDQLDKPIVEVQQEIVKSLNKEILSYTDYELVLEENQAKLIKRENVKPIGEGYFAKVYPYDIKGVKFAKKQLKNEFIRDREVVHRFKREYELMQEMNNSEHTINVVDFDEHDNSFIMEFAEKTLKEFMVENNHIVNTQWREHICERIILGLIDVHKVTLHRDLSYNNILMVAGNPKFADFGLGKDLNKEYSYKTISESGVGTPHFTDPIQHENIKNASVQTDIYSLGKIVDFVLCGSIASFDHKYSSLITKATHKDLGKRYNSVEEFYSAFLSIKNANTFIDPFLEIEEMYEQGNISTEKLYGFFTRNDGGNTLFQLFLRNEQAAVEVLDIYSVQFEHELEPLLRDMFFSLKEERLSFPQYDRFGRMAMNLLKNLGHNLLLSGVLADVVDFCADDINRFNIQDLRRDNINNLKIPYGIRQRWIQR